jgi:hypothetical protein
MIPILIRAKDRINYLNITLKSLTATNIGNSIIIIADNCSTSNEMNKFLFTSEEIESENIRGIGNKFSTIRPNTSNNDVFGLLWTMMAGFELFQNTDRIVILDDDLIFNSNWFQISNYIFNKELNTNVGIVSVFNNDSEDSKYLKLYNEKKYVSSAMFMIHRDLYNTLKRSGVYSSKINIDESTSGDIFLQRFAYANEFKILNTNDSYIQHIGNENTRNFIEPCAWNEEF